MPLILARARTHQPGAADRAGQEVFPDLLGADTQDIRPGPSHHGDMTAEPVTHPGAPSRTPRVLAIALFALALAGCLTAIVVALASGMSFSAAVNAYTVTDGAMALAFPVCGVLLAWYRPRNPIGWLFLAAGLGMASTTVAGPFLILGVQRDWSQVTLRVLATVGSYGWP
jgi:F0F1-type ATP synthase membrane subunit c/vacuolar-type H+-ATPase subunit K